MGFFDQIDEADKPFLIASLLSNMGQSLQGKGGNPFDVLSGYQSMREQQKMNQLRQKQMEQEQADKDQARSDQQFMRDTAAQNYRSPAMQSLAAEGRGPTQTAADAIGNYRPQFDQEGFINAIASRNPLQAIELRAKMAKETPKMHLVDVEDPANPGRTIKRWVREGEAAGVDVGMVPQKERQAPEGMTIGPDGRYQIIPGYLDMRKQIAAAGRAPQLPTPAQMVQTDQGMMMFDPRQRTMQPAMMPDGRPVMPKLKDIPATASTAIMENRKAMQQIDDAIASVQSNPDALGAWNYAGDAIRQRTDPSGVDARAKVAQVGGIRLHDLSGAAVTATELKRLQPYIPTSTDNPKAALQKLQALRGEYANMLSQQEGMYSQDQGYRALPQQKKAQGGFRIISVE